MPRQFLAESRLEWSRALLATGDEGFMRCFLSTKNRSGYVFITTTGGTIASIFAARKFPKSLIMGLAPGVRPVAFPRTLAAGFGGRQRQLSGALGYGPYLVLYTAGYGTAAGASEVQPVRRQRDEGPGDRPRAPPGPGARRAAPRAPLSGDARMLTTQPQLVRCDRSFARCSNWTAHFSIFSLYKSPKSIHKSVYTT